MSVHGADFRRFLYLGNVTDGAELWMAGIECGAQGTGLRARGKAKCPDLKFSTMRINSVKKILCLFLIFSCINANGQNKIFKSEKAYIGFSPGLSVLIGSDLGFRSNLNAGYLLTDHIGISGLLFISTHTIESRDGTGPGRFNPIVGKESWTYEGMLPGPSFSIFPEGKTYWHISPMAGYCKIIRPEYYQDAPSRFSFDLSTDFIFNSDKRIAISVSSDLFLTEYVFSRFQSITINAGTGLIYRFRKR